MPSMEARLSRIEGRIDEQSHTLREVCTDVRHIDDRMSRQFMWLVGVVLTTFAALLAAILSRG
jgi:uncharacterized coiled-coil protein SlyX